MAAVVGAVGGFANLELALRIQLPIATQDARWPKRLTVQAWAWSGTNKRPPCSDIICFKYLALSV